MSLKNQEIEVKVNSKKGAFKNVVGTGVFISCSHRETFIVGPAGRTLSTLGLAVSCNNYVCST